VGLLLYIGMAIIVPLEPVSAEAAGEATVEPEGHRHAARGGGPWTTVVGFGLILFGSLALLDRLLPTWDVEHFVVPAVTIVIGAFLVARAVRREPMES
jgi:hypothetical protein